MFKFIQTNDGSPSLRVAFGALNDEVNNGPKDGFGDGFGDGSGAASGGQTSGAVAEFSGHSDGLSASMHNLRGAFSETVYIYGKGIEASLERGFRPRVLSLGLGLGYVEILSAALFLKHAVPEDLAGGESFELIPELSAWFAAWVSGKGSIPNDFHRAYELILERSATEAKVEPAKVKALLKSMLECGRWTLRGPLSLGTKIEERFGTICFDAFCSKNSPDLWTDEFLNDFFARSAASGCVVSSYACTGGLKRSLKQLGFAVEIRPGFAYKRASTFAVRG